MHPFSDEPLLSRPARNLYALRAAVSEVASLRLPEFIDEMQSAFVRAGNENSAVPIHLFYLKWAIVIEIKRHPETARYLHAAERAVDSPDPDVRKQGARDAGEIVQAAHRNIWAA